MLQLTIEEQGARSRISHLERWVEKDKIPILLNLTPTTNTVEIYTEEMIMAEADMIMAGAAPPQEVEEDLKDPTSEAPLLEEAQLQNSTETDPSQEQEMLEVATLQPLEETGLAVTNLEPIPC